MVAIWYPFDTSRLKLFLKYGSMAEDAAHKLHAVGEGSWEIHKRAAQSGEHLSRKHNLDE